VIFHASPTTPSGTARSQYASWLASVEGQIAALRAAKGGVGRELSQREVNMLALDWYGGSTVLSSRSQGGSKRERPVAVQRGPRPGTSCGPALPLGAQRKPNRTLGSPELDWEYRPSVTP
jgi:hypothetical protein